MTQIYYQKRETLPQLTPAQAKWWQQTLILLFGEKPFLLTSSFEGKNFVPEVRIDRFHPEDNTSRLPVTLGSRETCLSFDHGHYLMTLESELYIEDRFVIVCKMRSGAGYDCIVTMRPIDTNALTDEEYTLWSKAKKYSLRIDPPSIKEEENVT